MTRRGWTLLIALGVIWGIPYLFIRIAVEWFSPATLVLLRVVLAAAILLPIAFARGELRHLRGHWRWILVFAVVEIGIAWLAINWAETSLTSSLTALLIASVPSIAAITAQLLGYDRLSRGRVLGLALGFAGVAFLVGLDLASTSIAAMLAVLVAAVCYATAPIIAERRLSDIPTIAVIAVSMVVNAVIFAVPGIAQWPTQTPPAPAWIAVAILGLVCSALAFIVFFRLIAEVGAARMTLITYINPVVAVLLGIAVLGEPFTLGMAFGFPLILIGSWLATRRGPAIESEPAPV